MNEDLGKWFVDTLGKRFHVNFLGYAHWFMSIIIPHMMDHSISVDQGRYADYFPEYSNYFGRFLILLKSMHYMNNSGKLFTDDLT